MWFPLLDGIRTSDFLTVHTAHCLHYCVTKFTDIVSHTNTLILHTCTTLVVEATIGRAGANLHTSNSVNYLQPVCYITRTLCHRYLTLSVLRTSKKRSANNAGNGKSWSDIFKLTPSMELTLQHNCIRTM
jgi:hypothetical protein